MHIEFLPWSSIPDFDSAWSIVREAGRDNGGVLLDTWHYLRSGGTPEYLDTLSLDRIYAVQVSDAPAVAESNLMEEAMARRLLPGMGAARVRDVVTALSDGGCTAPVGVEVFSTELAALPGAEVIELLARATRATLGEA